MINKLFTIDPNQRKNAVLDIENFGITKSYEEDKPKKKKDEVMELDKNSKAKIGNKFF